MFVTIIISKQSFRDLKNEIELKNVEIDEMSMERDAKNEEINNEDLLHPTQI